MRSPRGKDQGIQLRGRGEGARAQKKEEDPLHVTQEQKKFAYVFQQLNPTPTVHSTGSALWQRSREYYYKVLSRLHKMRQSAQAFNSDLTRRIVCFFVLFCFVLFCFVLFCFVLFCFVLFCFVLFCFVLFCFVFDRNDTRFIRLTLYSYFLI
jgi:Flp pilus assembly protein TadB